MTQATFALSAFGDEIAVNLFDQLVVLNELRIRYLELRTVWARTCSTSTTMKPARSPPCVGTPALPSAQSAAPSASRRSPSRWQGRWTNWSASCALQRW